MGGNIPVRGAQVQQTSLVVTVLCRPRLMLGDAAMNCSQAKDDGILTPQMVSGNTDHQK